MPQSSTRPLSAAIALFALLALGSHASPAQAHSRSVPAVLVAPPSSQSCPIDFYVSRNAGLRLDRAEDGATRPEEKGRLDLSFHPPESRDLVSVKLTVHAQNPGLRVSPISLQSASETTETFTLNAPPANRTLVRSAVSLRRSNLVLWVDLTEIRYADGGIWRASPQSACIAAPSGYRLVADLR